MARLSWAEVCARRLGRHALADPSAEARPADVVAAMCGAHAQVLSAAELSIGIRIPGSSRAEIRDALWRERSLVKTYGPRGTVHLLPTGDLPMWCGALAAIPPVRSVHDRNELLTPDQTDAVVAAIGSALADAELTVDELTEAVVAIAGPWAGDPVMEAFQGKWPRWRRATSTAANRGALCFGPNRGVRVTYTSPHRWLPGLRPLEGPTAHRELLKRYLHAYGPATPLHFAQWLNAPRRWATELFDALAGELEPVEVDGRAGWVAAGDAAPPPAPPGGVRLLPYFDAYAVGGQPRELLFPGRAAERALAGGQAGNFPVLLVDGVVAGVWHQRRAGKRIEITVEPFGELTPAQRAELDDQAALAAALLDGEPRLTIGTVAVGAHA
jgi:hypothetical protein